MFPVARTRTLIGPADPARSVTVAPPSVAARELIDRAGVVEPAAHRRARPTRRLVLTAGTLAAAAGAVAVLRPSGESTPDAPGGPGGAAGLVLVPVAYQFDADPPAAGPRLRALANKIKDAGYDHRSGRYMFHHTKVWGDPVMSSPDDRHHVAFVGETKVWQAADGTGSQANSQLEPQYPDEESRAYWQRKLPQGRGGDDPSLIPLPPMELSPPPADPARLRKLLKIEYGPGAASKAVSTLYARYVIPRPVRAQILRVLADLPGLRWRGQVTDRVGRAGVAVTYDDREHGVQFLLIFDEGTGGLLAHEMLTLAPVRLSAYQVILDSSWTDHVG
ncbi:CU044_5270 family protein [Micromonospora sp. NPDC005174]|uniref:CU044_5270 family protein n=1 Tax=Micromonospora sp. NPDC005174 TaxID=3157018 RepID=UPI0033AC8F32